MAELNARIGAAGWAIPAALADRFAGEGSHLERYARQFPVAEINSSFHRPHRRATYERWASRVPAGFRFAVKLPKTISHAQRLVDCTDLLGRFAEESGGLGDKRGPTLVQLPPSFAFPGELAERFFAELADSIEAPIVVEPRHASWLEPDVDAMLDRRRIARVAADPATGAARLPGGWRGLAYFRLHGSPRTYWSSYEPPVIAEHAAAVAQLEAGGAEVWTIFDNTASGAAIGNALALQEELVALGD